MKVCIIGNSLTTLSLAKNLVNKKVKVYNYVINNKKKKSISRTIGISRDNLDFFNKEIIHLRKKMIWNIKKIDIFTEKYQGQKIIDFDESKKILFSMLKNNEIIKCLETNLKKNILFKKILLKKNETLKKIINMNFDLVINCDSNNIITKEFFFRKIYKNYKSQALTCIIQHKILKNNIATQIFTKFGPIAFLPLSNSSTSIVFSVLNKNKKFSDNEILELIKFYNFKYKIFKFSKFERINLTFSAARNYFFKNVLGFGDVIHRVHPHAGQGFNITIRDIKVLSELIQKRVELGLPLDNSIFQEFEKKTKHLNYIFITTIDFIYEFFKFENKTNRNISKKLFKIIQNKNIKKLFLKYANEGIIL